MLTLLFFCSGLSGLIYQVVWVRQFGQVYGNTVYSASIVVAIFMVGLGAGGYLFGTWADRRYLARQEGLVRVYGGLELLIAGCGLLISLLLPHIAAVVARLSWYDAAPGGWHVLSLASYVWRAAIALLLLTPMTILMGGTFTVLVRSMVRADLHSAGWRVALLYGANTVGAAAGAFLTDFLLVPRVGLFGAQMAAVALNLVAAGGAFSLARRTTLIPGQTNKTRPAAAPQAIRQVSAASPAPRHVSPKRASSPGERRRESSRQTTGEIGTSPAGVRWVAAAVALSGFAALGMEILWLRHLGVLLGGFRSVFSLLLTIMLLALGTGALLAGWLDRRFAQPARTLMIVQALFTGTLLLGLASNDADALSARGVTIGATLAALSPSSRTVAELWFNLRPMLLEVALPCFVAGLALPLANAVVQNAEASVGGRAGVLYAANTVGAVCGSLATGYLLLPWLGMQSSAAILAGVASLAIGPLRFSQPRHRTDDRAVLAGAGLIAVGALVIWLMLPPDFIVRRALGSRGADERLVALSEGVTELLAVVERPGRGRGLLTNGHAMSSTAPLDQRYMRALAHIPLLMLDQPERVLVIGFGVGNTVHAATLHTSVTRVDVADLSSHILEHAGYFRDANGDVLNDPRVTTYVNDGRQHLQMTSSGPYDLITLEPPPIAHAGVSALYSREFYQLARSRLTSGGYVSQWLPAYQVPAESSLAMVRAFLDVFPQAVLLSGTQAELLLIGTTAPRIELDPVGVSAALTRERAVREDLARLDLGSVREIAGTFVGSAQTLARATRESPSVTDDRPLQEYGVLSGLSARLTGVPSALFDVSAVNAWCPGCGDDRQGQQAVPNLDLYLRLLQQAYLAPVADVVAAASAARGQRRILGSAYLGAVVPDSAEVHNLLGVAEMRDGRVDEAISEFRQALLEDPRSANARANLGQIRYDQGAALLELRRYAEASALLGEAVELMPDSAEALNDLGVALASMGRVGEAREHFRRAVTLAPGFAEARANLESAQESTHPVVSSRLRNASGERTGARGADAPAADDDGTSSR
jgi:predicted membrane-bound spermidine synthase